MRRITIAVAGALAATIVAAGAVVLWQPHWLVAMVAARSPHVLYFVETSEPVVALTIDDGPDLETTPKILHVLATHRAHATFFLITDRVAANEEVVAQIVAEGHELGNHLTRDEPSIDLSPRAFEASLMEADGVLSRFAPARWVRPGGGWYNASMLSTTRSRGYRVALGSVYPYDAEIPSRQFAIRHVSRNTRPGSIIILHDGGARGRRTVAVLERVLPELQRRGLRVVTISELVDER